MDKIWNLYPTAVEFIKQDIWRIRRTKLPPGKLFFIILIRVMILSIRGFDEDKCQLREIEL